MLGQHEQDVVDGLLGHRAQPATDDVEDLFGCRVWHPAHRLEHRDALRGHVQSVTAQPLRRIQRRVLRRIWAHPGRVTHNLD